MLDAHPDTMPTASRARRLTRALCLGLPAAAVLAFGGQLLVTGWTTDRAGGAHHVHDLAWGAMEGVLLLGALVAVLLRPARQAARLQALAVVAALLVTMVLVAAPDAFTVVLAVLVTVGVLTGGLRSVVSERRFRADVGVLCAVAAVPLLTWAVAAAADQRASGDAHAELLGYTGVTAFALALLATLVVAALGQPGWRVPAACAAVAAGIVGTAGALWPADASSPGRLGGAALVAAGVAAAVLALRRGGEPRDR